MNPLSSIRIRNYRCFLDHTIRLGRDTIVVGKNNAGKSTLIETLRIASVALRRFQNPVATQAPHWLDDYAPGSGQKLNLARMGLLTEALFHRYGDAPAIIEAGFQDGARLVVYVGDDGEAHSVFFNGQGRAIRRRRDIADSSLPRINILPQIVPLEREEKLLDADYVKQHLDSTLASRHFRNQLMILREDFFEDFRQLVEDSWPGVRIDGVDSANSENGQLIQLMIRDGNFVAEAGWMGHGLQMWLQTLWFIVRARGGGTIVLDEPDVYMHPDLQRRLVRMLRSQPSDLLIATHSTEILAEVDAENVLVLDRGLPRSSYATDFPSVQRIIEKMGSAQNLQIARLWRAKSLILVEGEDMKILKRVHDLIRPASALPLDAIPNWAIGGWTGWNIALGSIDALQNSVHESIRCYCIFDSDYHLEGEIRERVQRAEDRNIELHIHTVKEIENFLLIPPLIRRVIERSIKPTEALPTEVEISSAIDDIVNSMLPATQDCFASEIHNANKSMGVASASRQARELVDSRRTGARGTWGLVPGKEVLSRLSTWSRSQCQVSFGVNSLIRHLRSDEVDEELAQLVRAISDGRRLPRRALA